MKRILFLGILLFATSVRAGRPLITDDASVVEDNKLQIETWAFIDKRSGQYWIVPTVGLENKVELSAAAVQGTPFEKDRAYTYSGPILQGKVYIHKSRSDWDPAIALSGGGIAPYGHGQLKTEKWDYFYYGAFTFHPENNLFLHLNLGQQTRRSSDQPGSVFLWGAAVEWGVTEKTHLFTEAANGDVYAVIPGVAVQIGGRHDLTETFQIDGTLGRGFSGDPILPIWVTVGVKLLFDI